jgi:pimeloyl-ACP methyl ester carboxylesterase
MVTIQRDGITLAYDERGVGEPPVLLIHGMACDRATMDAQLDHFGSVHRTVAYDQRGHGESDKPLDAAYGPAALADDARWLIEALGLDRPVVIGHSLGGTIALALAAAHPELTSALVMLDSTFGFDAEAGAGLSAFYEALTEDTYGDTVRAFVSQRLFDDGDDPALSARVLDLMAGCPMPVFVGMGRSLLDFDVPAAVAAVTVPTLFIASSRPWVDLGDVHRARPDWYLGRTVGAGHFHNALVADQVNPMIDAFLTRVDVGIPSAEPAEF